MSNPSPERYTDLDGMRGWAALLVLLNHLSLTFLVGLPNFHIGLPLIFANGDMAVQVFFVISGFVLSVGYFHYPSQHYIAIMAVRRYPRLTIPIMVIFLLTCLFIQCGLLYNKELEALLPANFWLHNDYQQPFALLDMLHYALFYVYVEYQRYGYSHLCPPIWTMPVEFMGSMALFFMLSLYRYLHKPLIWCIAVGITLSLFNTPTSSWCLAMLYGVILAFWTQKPFLQRLRLSRWSAASGAILLLGGICLSGIPWIKYVPPLYALAGTMIVASTLCSRPIAAFFNLRLSQFLGKISFSLYLTHMLVIVSFSSFLYVFLCHHGYALAAASYIVYFITVFISLLAATLFLPVDRFAIWLSHRISAALIKPKPAN